MRSFAGKTRSPSLSPGVLLRSKKNYCTPYILSARSGAIAGSADGPALLPAAASGCLVSQIGSDLLLLTVLVSACMMGEASQLGQPVVYSARGLY